MKNAKDIVAGDSVRFFNTLTNQDTIVQINNLSVLNYGIIKESIEKDKILVSNNPNELVKPFDLILIKSKEGDMIPYIVKSNESVRDIIPIIDKIWIPDQFGNYRLVVFWVEHRENESSA